MNNYSLKTSSQENFTEVVEKTKSLLEEQGFGVLTNIDIKQKIKNKIGSNIDDYRIIGACNPEFAYNVLKENKNIGLFLPCSVVVYKDGKQTFVEIMKPTFTDQFFESGKIAEVSEKVEEQLQYVISNIN